MFAYSLGGDGVAKPRRILLVEEHPLLREGAKAVLAQCAEFELVAEAGTAREGLQLAQELRPDLVIQGISFPDRDGVHLTCDIHAEIPEVPILVLSAHDDIDHITRAFHAGAMGYLVKDSASARLLEALETIADGRHFLDVSLSDAIVKKLTDPRRPGEVVTDASYNSLTSREKEVLHLLAEGLPIKGIAQRLFISPKTVENHQAKIRAKLGLHTAVELTRYMVRLGFIEVDAWKEEAGPSEGN